MSFFSISLLLFHFTALQLVRTTVIHLVTLTGWQTFTRAGPATGQVEYCSLTRWCKHRPFERVSRLDKHWPKARAARVPGADPKIFLKGWARPEQKKLDSSCQKPMKPLSVPPPLPFPSPALIRFKTSSFSGFHLSSFLRWFLLSVFCSNYANSYGRPITVSSGSKGCTSTTGCRSLTVSYVNSLCPHSYQF